MPRTQQGQGPERLPAECRIQYPHFERAHIALPSILVSTQLLFVVGDDKLEFRLIWCVVQGARPRSCMKMPAALSHAADEIVSSLKCIPSRFFCGREPLYQV